nr:MAG TPA: hypothetical protein [Caudoviricetes sp.]
MIKHEIYQFSCSPKLFIFGLVLTCFFTNSLTYKNYFKSFV